ncbi:MAG: hypothetical protein AAF483_12800 [Planctomycetota bacterium]
MHNANASESSKGGGTRQKQSFWWAFFAVLLPPLIAASCLGESLWVDELHTSWCISDGFADIFERASAGNQSGSYMYLQRSLQFCLGLLGQQAEDWHLRLLSIVALATLCSLVFQHLVRILQRPGSENLHSTLTVAPGTYWLCLLIIVGWIGFERTQLFYATEARVYGLLQVLQLFGWICVVRLLCSQKFSSVAPARKRYENRWLIAWTICGIASMYLHLIAIIAFTWQFTAIVTGVFLQQRFTMLRSLALAGVGVFLICIPAAFQGIPVWQKRSQWLSFASDISMENAGAMLAFWPLLIPPLVGCYLDRILTGKEVTSNENTKEDKSFLYGNLAIWGCATFAPCLMAWLVTASGIAPIFHQRYLLCSAIPLVLLAASLLSLIRIHWLRFATAFFVIGALTWQQGHTTAWQHGQLIGGLRGEDWRSASKWIQQEISQGSATRSEIWCLSGLIEGENAQTPLLREFDAYLSFPLRGIYAVKDSSGETIEPHALVPDARLWPKQWSERAGDAKMRELFLVCRARNTQLQHVLLELQSESASQDHRLEVSTEIKSFGTLSATSIRWTNRQQTQ